MKEHQILFSAAMVRAILEGRKTQTRRVITKHATDESGEPAAAIYPARVDGWISWWPDDSPNLAEFTKRAYEHGWTCPYGKAGDVLRVRGPRWASSITLEITKVRAERVQDISEEDAKAEGAPQEFRTVIPVGGKPEGCTKPYSMPVSYRAGFANLWDRINAPRGFGWDKNPWAWVISFRRLETAERAA